ncbi:MAG: type II secretion system F family protein [Chloroflexi bacterium]|nr:type II secretion system F family protein [Chloroflexota bacterium]
MPITGLLAALFAALTIAVALGLLLRWQPWSSAARTQERYAVSRGLVQPPAVPDAPPGKRQLADRLAGAGLPLGANPVLAYYLVAGGLALAGAGAVLILGLPPILAAVAAVAGFLAPQFWLSRQEAARRQAIDRAIPQGIGLIIAALRINPALPEALTDAAATLDQIDEPHLAHELQATVAEMRTAGSVTEPLQDLAQRTPSASLRYVVQLLIVYAQEGGSFLTVLNEKANAIREILATRQNAQAKAADTKMAMLAIPALLAGVGLMQLQDPQFRAFYESLMGQALLAGVLVMMAFGYWLVNSMLEEV